MYSVLLFWFHFQIYKEFKTYLTVNGPINTFMKVIIVINLAVTISKILCYQIDFDLIHFMLYRMQQQYIINSEKVKIYIST